MYRRAVVLLVAAVALTISACSSESQPVAGPQTVTATMTTQVPTTVVRTESEVRTSIKTRVTERLRTVVKTVVKTVSIDVAAESSSKAAESSRVAAEASTKTGVDGYLAQMEAAGLDPAQMGEEYVDPVSACERLESNDEPFYSLGSEMYWREYFENPDPDIITALKILVKNVCPKFQDKIDEQVARKSLAPQMKFAEWIEGSYESASYLIPSELVPGVYQTVSKKVTDCYWELSDASGNIIDNNAITAAPQFSVTVPATAAAFSVSGCSFKWVGDS